MAMGTIARSMRRRLERARARVAECCAIVGVLLRENGLVWRGAVGRATAREE